MPSTQERLLCCRGSGQVHRRLVPTAGAWRRVETTRRNGTDRQCGHIQTTSFLRCHLSSETPAPQNPALPESCLPTHGARPPGHPPRSKAFPLAQASPSPHLRHPDSPSVDPHLSEVPLSPTGHHIGPNKSHCRPQRIASPMAPPLMGSITGHASCDQAKNSRSICLLPSVAPVCTRCVPGTGR